MLMPHKRHHAIRGGAKRLRKGKGFRCEVASYPEEGLDNLLVFPAKKRAGGIQ
jgi:hypothetical protein